MASEVTSELPLELRYATAAVTLRCFVVSGLVPCAAAADANMRDAIATDTNAGTTPPRVGMVGHSMLEDSRGEPGARARRAGS